MTEMEGLFDSTTTEQPEALSEDTIETPAESETAQQTVEPEADTSPGEETTQELKRVAFKYGDVEYDLDLPEEVADIAKNGIMMQAEFTRHKQEFSAKEKAMAAREPEIDSALNEMRQALEFEKEFMESTEMQELKTYDRDEYDQRYDAVQTKIQKYNGYLNERNEKRKEEGQQTFEAEQSKYTELVPEWLDEDVKKTEFAEMGKYLEDNGFSQTEIEGMFPARHMKTLRLAMLYEKTRKSAQSKKQTVPPKSASPGSSNKAKPEASMYDMFAAQMK